MWAEIKSAKVATGLCLPKQKTCCSLNFSTIYRIPITRSRKWTSELERVPWSSNGRRKLPATPVRPSFSSAHSIMTRNVGTPICSTWIRCQLLTSIQERIAHLSLPKSKASQLSANQTPNPSFSLSLVTKPHHPPPKPSSDNPRS